MRCWAGDNGTGFSTPLGTVWRFNGWADTFSTTPVNGLRDAYIDIGILTKNIEGSFAFLNGLHTKLQYHDYASDGGDMNYGYEWGALLTKRLNEHYALELKYADYHAESFATDTQKMVFGLQINY